MIFSRNKINEKVGILRDRHWNVPMIQEKGERSSKKNITATPLFLLEKINDNANYHNEHVHNLTVAAI